MIYPKVKIQEWCDELRSGKWKQTKGYLQDERGYCCLGVLVEMTVKNPKRCGETGFLMGILPEAQPNSPTWVKKINDEFMKRADTLLSSLNDQEDALTFDEIADCIEAVFIHEVLK